MNKSKFVNYLIEVIVAEAVAWLIRRIQRG